MGYQPPLPNSARLIDWGHSWTAPPPYPYATSNIVTNGLPPDNEQWFFALRDALGIGGTTSNTRAYYIPPTAAGTATTTYPLDFLGMDSTIEAVFYLPATNITGANTNTRGVAIGVSDYGAASSQVQFLSNLNLTAGTTLLAMASNPILTCNVASEFFDTTNTTRAASPYFPSLYGYGTNYSFSSARTVLWQSTKIGTGGATNDPGGAVIVRYGTRYRNYGVAGSTLLGDNSSATYKYGSWWSPFSWSPYGRPAAAEVNVTLTATGGATSISCSPLQFAGFVSGAVIKFSNGVLATLTAAPNFGATSISVSALSGPIPAGAQGHYVASNYGLIGGYDKLSPTGINVWVHGINDANYATQDVPAWTEAVRAVIAKNCSPHWNYTGGNIVPTNGAGTWHTQAPIPGPYATLGGALPYCVSPYYDGNGNGVEPFNWWGGTSPTSSDTLSFTVGPAFEGGTIDVMFLAVAGSSLGVGGSITVDGTDPPQGTVTFSTNNLSTSGIGLNNPGGTITTSGSSTTITGAGTTFSQKDVGKTLVYAGSIPGLVITAVTTGTQITVNQAVNIASGVSCTTNSWYPMVKRITGLSAGAHTVKLTVTSSASSQASLWLYGFGFESQNPTTPVLWCNVARSPSQTSGQKTNSVALNAASLAVINGTATPITGNTAEPALGTNVQYVDIDTLFGGATPNVNLFLPDGIHPNTAGHRLMARTLFSAIRNNFSPDQLMAR